MSPYILPACLPASYACCVPFQGPDFKLGIPSFSQTLGKLAQRLCSVSFQGIFQGFRQHQ